MPFLQSLAALFNTSGNPSAAAASRHKTRQSVVQGTMDAFSLPTTRYPNGVSQTDSASSSPGPSRRASTYTSYPPPKEAYQPALSYYPPLSNTYHRLRNSLSDSFPELIDTLNYPIDPAVLSSFESELGCPLPPPVRESFLVADGQDMEASINLGAAGSFFGLHFLPLEEVMREWAFWRQAEHDPSSGQNAAVLATMASAPPKWIKSLYACRGWIPLMSDRSGNYIGVDLDPGEGGSWGQVIVFGRDFDRKCVLWKGEGEGGWGKWLAGFVDELESGEGWEADKSHSSDEEDEVGYTTYGGGGASGEAGRALRLAGDYRGWTTLEAWWDKSVRRWEELGLGLDVEEVERGLTEARRLAGYDDGGAQDGSASGSGSGAGIGMGVGDSSAQVEIPVLPSPRIPQPGTPTPHDSDALLPPASPDTSSVPKIHQPSPSPVRVITPLPSTESHPLASGSNNPSNSDARGFLSPPTRSPPRSKRRSRPPPAPTPLDLPTRADVQAMSAIAMAEDSGLRGGWVMNLDPTGNARRGAGAAGQGLGMGMGMGHRDGSERDMVDVDLEGARGDAAQWRLEMERQREEEKLAMAGVEHRRLSPNLLGRDSFSAISTGSGGGGGGGVGGISGSGYHSPSPLSRSTSPSPSPTPSFDPTDSTPRAIIRDDPMVAHPSVIEATNRLRRPPPARNGSTSPAEGDRDRDYERDRESKVIRSRPSSIAFGSHAPRVQREASTTSLNSEHGLLRGQSEIFEHQLPGGAGGMSGGAYPMSTSSSRDHQERFERLERPVRSSTATPPIVYSSPVTSPSRLGFGGQGQGQGHVQGQGTDGVVGLGLGAAQGGEAGRGVKVEDLMEEISLDDSGAAGAGGAAKVGVAEGEKRKSWIAA